MADIEKLFKQYWELLKGGELDLPDEANEPMYNAWLKVDWNILKTSSTSTSTSTSTKRSSNVVKSSRKGKPTSYNVFVREISQLPEVKAMVGGERLKECARRWKLITKEEKDVWVQKANEIGESRKDETSTSTSTSTAPKSSGKSGSSGVRHPSGYNRFYSAMSSVLKERKIESTKRMGIIADLWRKVGPDEQQKWKDIAADQAPLPSIDELISLLPIEETHEPVPDNN